MLVTHFDNIWPGKLFVRVKSLYHDKKISPRVRESNIFFLLESGIQPPMKSGIYHGRTTKATKLTENA